METKSLTGAKWYVELTLAFNSLAEQLQLDPEAVDTLRTFLIEKCKEQYLTGNKSGIAWLKRMQAEEAAKRGQTVSNHYVAMTPATA